MIYIRSDTRRYQIAVLKVILDTVQVSLNIAPRVVFQSFSLNASSYMRGIDNEYSAPSKGVTVTILHLHRLDMRLDMSVQLSLIRPRFLLVEDG